MDYSDFEKNIGYVFSNQSILLEALTHSTYAYEHPEEGIKENERLEFLGDSVLGLTVSEKLFRVTPPLPEGKMSRMRAQIVREDTLVRMANDIELAKYLRLGKGEETTGGRKKASNLADAVEAVFGAVYLDGGFEAAFATVWHCVQKYFQLALEGKLCYDFKTLLLEQVQAKGTQQSVEFVVVDETGPVHNRVYTVQVHINGEQCGEGVGSSKKAAEQQAAGRALGVL